MAEAAERTDGAKESSNRLVLYAALAANLGIAAAKFVAAALTGSSAMLTEGFHSVVDSVNQLLLLYGEHRAERPPDARHPLGYGRELYFWSFVVAILIFATGAGLSIYEGVLHILAPAPVEDVRVAYAVLAVSILLEGGSFLTAVRAFARDKGELGWWKAIHRSKDPSTFIVLFEDSAALFGLVVAGAGITLSRLTGDPTWDGAASIAIGCALAVVAVLLAREAKGLLIGEAADPALVKGVAEAFAARPEVTRVGQVVTVHVAPKKVFVAADVDFADEGRVGALEAVIAETEAALRLDWPEILALYVKPKAA